MYLAANCQMPHNKEKNNNHGMRWQVPWGKHQVEQHKWSNTAKNDKLVNKTTVLPAVLVRDPLSWMQSMCTHPYAAKWKHEKLHCPNLVADNNNSSVPVSIAYPGGTLRWESLVHLWNDWYGQYVNADYPRLLIRYVNFYCPVASNTKIVSDWLTRIAISIFF